MPVKGDVSRTNSILKVIQKHPEGVKLVQLGNALGVNWRTLIGAVGFLVDEGKIGKVDNIYYPIICRSRADKEMDYE